MSHTWWWRQHVPLKRRSTIILHGNTSQKTVLNFILTAVRTLNFTWSSKTLRKCELCSDMLMDKRLSLVLWKLESVLCYLSQMLISSKLLLLHRYSAAITRAINKISCVIYSVTQQCRLAYTFASDSFLDLWGHLRGTIQIKRYGPEAHKTNDLSPDSELVRLEVCLAWRPGICLVARVILRFRPG
jgi:hypothetical protein